MRCELALEAARRRSGTRGPRSRAACPSCRSGRVAIPRRDVRARTNAARPEGGRRSRKSPIPGLTRGSLPTHEDGWRPSAPGPAHGDRRDPTAAAGGVDSRGGSERRWPLLSDTGSLPGECLVAASAAYQKPETMCHGQLLPSTRSERELAAGCRSSLTARQDPASTRHGACSLSARCRAQRGAAQMPEPSAKEVAVGRDFSTHRERPEQPMAPNVSGESRLLDQL